MRFAILSLAIAPIFVVTHSTILNAKDQRAVDLLPASTIAYVEIADPKQVLDVVLDHPLRHRVESLEDVQKAMSTQVYLEFKAVVAVIESRIGMKWREALETITAGGIHAGVDAQTEGVAILVYSADQAKLEQIRDTLLKLAREDAARKGNEDPIKSMQYRGITAYQADKARFATFDKWLLMTNKDDLGKRILDAHLDGNGDSLANNQQFQTAEQTRTGKPSAWAFLNIEALREAGVAKGLFKGQADNPAGELLVGGLLSNLQKTPLATASLRLDRRQFQLTFTVPHDHAWIGPERHYYFGADGHGAAPPLLSVENRLFSLSTFRDVSQMWLRAGDLFDEKANDELAKADSNLSTLFSGKDFGEEILGSFKPEIQLIATRQDFADVMPKPAIRLPAFALVFRLREPAVMQPELRRTFQSLIGFLNVVGAMNGQPQLDQDIQKEGGKQIVSATYLPEVDETESTKAKINFNFSPSVAFVDDLFVVSSTKALARRIVDSAAKATAVVEAGLAPNTAMKLDVPVLGQILRDNRAQLVAQNMLEEGHGKEEAEKEIDALLALAGLLRDASLKLDVGTSRMQLEIEVNLMEVE